MVSIAGLCVAATDTCDLRHAEPLRHGSLGQIVFSPIRKHLYGESTSQGSPLPLCPECRVTHLVGEHLIARFQVTELHGLPLVVRSQCPLAIPHVVSVHS